MTLLRITAGPFTFVARMEELNAPLTCRAFRKLLPFRSKVIQARWSGEAGWVPLGSFDIGVGYENHTSRPSPGEILFYPGGLSETEILIPYGITCFSSKVGRLTGNHFLTIIEGGDSLAEFGQTVLWKGALDIEFDVAPA